VSAVDDITSPSPAALGDHSNLVATKERVAMDPKDKLTEGQALVARLLTPAEIDSVAGGDFQTYAQDAGGYCRFNQTGGGYDQHCVSKPPA